MRCHLISFSSTVQQRVVSSTIKSETYQLSDVVESADLIRAAIADVHGALDRMQWETTAAKFMKSVWYTDCRSAYDTLQKPVAKTVDKRLGMELASLRQLLWRKPGEGCVDVKFLEERRADPTGSMRWIDTTVMVADCLTKLLKGDFLHIVVDTNIWNFRQPAEARSVKLKKQIQRRRTKDERHGTEASLHEVVRYI